MKLLFKRPANDLFKFKRVKTNRYGGSANMDYDTT